MQSMTRTTKANELKEGMISCSLEIIAEIKEAIRTKNVREVNTCYVFASSGQIVRCSADDVCDLNLSAEVIKRVAEDEHAVGILVVTSFPQSKSIACATPASTLGEGPDLILASFLETYLGDFSQLTYYKNSEMVYERATTQIAASSVISLLPKPNAAVQA